MRWKKFLPPTLNYVLFNLIWVNYKHVQRMKPFKNKFSNEKQTLTFPMRMKETQIQRWNWKLDFEYQFLEIWYHPRVLSGNLWNQILTNYSRALLPTGGPRNLLSLADLWSHSQHLHAVQNIQNFLNDINLYIIIHLYRNWIGVGLTDSYCHRCCGYVSRWITD